MFSDSKKSKFFKATSKPAAKCYWKASTLFKGTCKCKAMLFFKTKKEKKKDPGSDNSLHFLPQEMIKVAENLLFLAKLLSETEGVEPTHGVCSLAARGDVADGKGGGTRGNL